MDIIVEGIGRKTYKPQKAVVKINFYTKAKTYESALEEGTENVELFVSKVLTELDFKKEDLKTSNFKVSEEQKYDKHKDEYIQDGYGYSQSSILKFDYSVKKMAEFIEKVADLKNPPKYTITFNVDNVEACKNEVLAEAYNSAKVKAEAIAAAAGKILKSCIKVSFRPFDESVTSNSRFANTDMLSDAKAMRMKTGAVQSSIANTFVPEDIEISETLYCLWLAE